MKRLIRFLPALTIFAGIVTATLRAVLLLSADEKGLIPQGTTAQIFLIILSLALLAVLAVSALLWKGRDFRILLPVPVQAVGCFAMAIAYLLQIMFSQESVLLFTVFRIAILACFAVLGIYRLQAKKPPLLFFAIISLSMMVLCFGQYRAWGQSTQVIVYLFPALATLLVALYSLEFCYMELQERNARRTFFINQAALFCCLTCLFSGDWFYYGTVSIWLISGLFTMPYAMNLPGDVKRCIAMLEKEGYTAYAVGGCVRDSMLGLKPHDYDLCTSATPAQICEVFHRYKLIRNGEKHGTIGVIMDDNTYEITTYRTESGYADNRHPDQVVFVDRIDADLARRDFTVNAMAYHPKTGYLDPYGGQKDLYLGILRTVGDPETRFKEDALRILRGVRFACRFRLDPEPDTEKAMKRMANLQENLARERVYSELTQLLCYLKKGDLKRFSPILLQIIPELKESVNFRQHSVHHAYDVFTHTDRVLTATEPHPVLRWAALLHDIGKPQTFQKDEQGQGHFHGHAKVSAEIADQILLRLKASNALREQVVFLISHHMDTITEDPALLTKKLSKYGSDNLKMLIRLQMADDTGKGKKKVNIKHYEKLIKAVEKLEKQCDCLQIRDLAINGHDLMELGFEQGPDLGQCQQALLEAVLNGEIPNEKDALTQKAKEFLEK